MPMIDVYATAGTFEGKHQLAQDLAVAVTDDVKAYYPKLDVAVEIPPP
jgi:hypothetical protein